MIRSDTVPVRIIRAIVAVAFLLVPAALLAEDSIGRAEETINWELLAELTDLDASYEGAHVVAISDENGCTGCYDERGRCVLGYDALRCGGDGVICVRCAAGEVCDPTDRTCRRCGRATCPGGCCDPLYGCQPGTSPYACGKDSKCTACIRTVVINGRQKEYCPDGKCVCVQGKCEACSKETCNGCCVDGRCYATTEDVSCGASCENCSRQGKLCWQGKCEPCEKVCAGCCKYGMCFTDMSNLYCGKGGAACERCEDGKTCDNGACVTCSPANCADGCCDPDYGCIPKQLQGERGDGTAVTPGRYPGCGQTGGVQCRSCRLNESCVNGVCKACSAETCPNGCCDPIFGCYSGYEWSACGPARSDCKRCKLDQYCSLERKCVDKPKPEPSASASPSPSASATATGIESPSPTPTSAPSATPTTSASSTPFETPTATATTTGTPSPATSVNPSPVSSPGPVTSWTPMPSPSWIGRTF